MTFKITIQFDSMVMTSITRVLRKKKKKTNSGVHIKNNYYTLTPRQAALRFLVPHNEFLR